MHTSLSLSHSSPLVSRCSRKDRRLGLWAEGEGATANASGMSRHISDDGDDDERKQEKRLMPHLHSLGTLAEQIP